MAYIYKQPIKVNKNKAQQLVYNTPLWKRLRQSKLIRQPLCEMCLEHDIITPADQVHHIIEFSNGATDEQIKWLGFAYDNLMSLCDECHKKQHKK